MIAELSKSTKIKLSFINLFYYILNAKHFHSVRSSLFAKLTTCGLYYKHVTFVNDDSSSVSK
jgi:hypothetical protein